MSRILFRVSVACRLRIVGLCVSVMMVLAVVEARSQSVWRYFRRPDFIAALVRYNVRSTLANPPIPFDRALNEIGGGVGFTVPFAKLGTDLSLAAISSAVVAGVPATVDAGDDLFPLTLSLEVPLYVAVKYGVDAVWYSQTQAGVGAGVGVAYGAFTTIDPIDVTALYLMPAFMVEFGVLVSGKLMKFRYSRLLGESLHEARDLDGVGIGEAAVTQQSAQLLITFGY